MESSSATHGILRFGSAETLTEYLEEVYQYTLNRSCFAGHGFASCTVVRTDRIVIRDKRALFQVYTDIELARERYRSMIRQQNLDLPFKPLGLLICDDPALPAPVAIIASELRRGFPLSQAQKIVITAAHSLLKRVYDMVNTYIAMHGMGPSSDFEVFVVPSVTNDPNLRNFYENPDSARIAANMIDWTKPGSAKYIRISGLTNLDAGDALAKQQAYVAKVMASAV